MKRLLPIVLVALCACAPKAGLRFRKFDGSPIPVEGAAIVDTEGRVIDKIVPAPPGTVLAPGDSLYLMLRFSYPKTGAPVEKPAVSHADDVLAQKAP